MATSFLIGAIVSVAAAVISGFVAAKSNQDNISMQRETNAQTQENFGRQQGFTEQQWEELKEREDTAHQREVVDLQAAGLSPLASLNGAQASTVSQPSAPSFVAPQYDTNFLSDLVRSASSSIMSASAGISGIRENQKDRDATRNDTLMRLNAAEQQLKMKIESESDLQTKRLLQENEHFLATLKLQETTQNRKATLELQDYALAQLDRFTGGQGSNFRYFEYDQYEEYLAARNLWFNNYTIFIDTNIDWLGTRTNDANSESASAGASANSRLPFPFPSAGASANTSASSTSNEQQDYTARFNALMRKFNQQHPYPVLKPKEYKGISH